MISTVIECVELDPELRFFADELGYRVSVVRPADDPRTVVVERDGHAVELRRSDADHPVRLSVERPSEQPTRVSPGGSIIEFHPICGELAIPLGEPVLSVVEPDDGAFGVGRAGMRYRDLLPSRWGGRFIASHIRIEQEGDVADWVHFHRIRFQMIYVAEGWVDVVYEGQGEPFRMVAGDCVLQPPEIRHRVLRSSSGLEVIEIGCPAEHDTIADPDVQLPTEPFEPTRTFGGQRFVRHVGAAASTAPWIDPALRCRDTGIGDATDGLAGAVVVTADDDASPRPLVHSGEFVQIVALSGHAVLAIDGTAVEFLPGAAVAIPPGSTWEWRRRSADHEALVVALPNDAIRPA